MGLQRRRLWASKLCMLFLAYRDFPEAFALAFRYRLPPEDNLEYICRKVSPSFLKRYLQHHDSLPTVQFGSPYIDFAALDELDGPKIDTVVYSHPCAKFNTMPCRITNIVVDRGVSTRSNPLIRKDRTLELHLDCLKTLEFNGAILYSVVLRMIKKTYAAVEKLNFGRVKLTVPAKCESIQETVNHINASVNFLWKYMLKHSGAVTVSAFYERSFIDLVFLHVCKTGFPEYTVTRSGCRVNCKLEKMAGNKSLKVFVSLY
uniref:BPI2 domain-containing protein n=1 Tax=Panagrellus redivivus TaxID=6233 RepID=A0A7E4ZW69_PANRE